MHQTQPPAARTASSQAQHVDASSPAASHSAQSRHRSVHQTPTTSHEPVASPVNMVGPSHPMPRQRVYFGPYLLLQTLGEGEFGKVKLGVHSSPERWGEEVAIKLIKRGNVDTQARMIKVAREIDVLKLVKHPNIVRLYDVIETEKYIGIVLEYASGGELFDHILAHRYLKEKDASKLFAQLISGVTYLHAKKIVHRDLKLENLLLDRNRNIIITDFGFANRFEDRTNDLMATSCGSPCYAAPELVVQDGRYVGSQVDVWSCGVILYAMLAGYLPFDDDPTNPDGDNINLLYKYIINTPLSFPDWITDEPKDLLLKMLVPDPLKRCSLKDVADHPWLAKYQHLFTRSLEELERLSEENEQAKRLMLQRQRQLMAANNANRSQPSLGPDGTRAHGSGNASAAHKARGHQSAMVVPSSAMVNPDESSQSSQAIGAYQQQQRQVPGGVVTHLHSNSYQPAPPPAPSNRRHQQAQSAVIVPVSSLNKENEVVPAPPQVPTDKMNIDEDIKTSGSNGNSGKKRRVNGAAPTSPSAHSGAANPQQRYTVQVEYTGAVKGKGKNVETSATRGETFESPHSPSQGATSNDDGQTSTPRMSTPAAATSSSSTPKQTHDSQIQTTPQPGRFSKAVAAGLSDTPTVLEPIAAGPDDTSTTPVPFPSPHQKPLANQGVPGAPKSASQVSFSTTSQNSALPNGTPKSSAAKSQARHRKGLSTDRFFSRLLGANATQPSNPPPVPNPKKATGYTTATPPAAPKTARRKALSMVVEPLSGKIASAAGARSNRKSVKVTPVTPNSAESQPAEQSKRRTRGTSVIAPASSHHSTDAASAPPPPPLPSSDKSRASSVKRRTTLASGHGRTTSSKMSTSGSAPQVAAVKKPGSQQSGPPVAEGTPPQEQEIALPQRDALNASPNWSQHTPAASVANSTGQASNSSKAKRVMDWFRFKSLNGSTTSANQAHPHGTEHLVPPVPIPTDFDARVKSHQTTQPGRPDRQPTANGNSPPVGSQPTSHIPAPLMSNQSVTQTSAVSSKASHRFTLAHPRPSTSTAAEFRNSPPMPTSGGERSGAFNDSKLKLHHGAIDQNAISSKLPLVIIQQLKQILWEMGIDVVEESTMKLKATRRSKKKVVASLGMGVFEALQQQQQKLQPQESSPGGGGRKSIFNRRPQTASSTNQQIGVLIDQFGHVTTGPSVGSTSAPGGPGSAGGSLGSASGAEYPSTAQPLPSYADDPSVDSGDDVRFTVEITRLRGLAGLYAVDIKRLKGSLWSFKYLYLQILDRADLGQKA